FLTHSPGKAKHNQRRAAAVPLANYAIIYSSLYRRARRSPRCGPVSRLARFVGLAGPCRRSWAVQGNPKTAKRGPGEMPGFDFFRKNPRFLGKWGATPLTRAGAGRYTFTIEIGSAFHEELY